MAKFCGRCGARLDSEGYCPNRCDGRGRGAAAPQPLSRKEQRALRKQAKHDAKKAAKQAKRDAKKAAKRAKRAAMTTGQKVGRFFLKLLGILLALAVLAAAAVCALVYFEIVDIPVVSSIMEKFVRTDAVETTDFQLLEEDAISRKVTDQESARQALDDIAPQLGIKDAEKELGECREDAVLGNTYYRFPQEYQGIPVYGRSVVVVADSAGNGTLVSGNLKGVGKLDTKPTISESEVPDFVRAYYNSEEFSCEVEELVIYSLNDREPTLAWQALVEADGEVEYCFVDAKTGDVLGALSQNYTEQVQCSGRDIDDVTQAFFAEYTDDLYVMEDTSKDITVYDANNSTLEIQWQVVDENGKFYTAKNGGWVDENGKSVMVKGIEGENFNLLILNDKGEVIGKNGEYAARLKTKNIFTTVSPVTSRTALWDNKKAVTVMSRVSLVDDFWAEVFHRKGYDNGYGAIVAVFDDYKDMDTTNAQSSGAKGVPITVLSFGTDNSLSLDAIAHEYTHSVERSISHMAYQGESGALMEAYSDIFGEIVEDWANDGMFDGDCDWIHNRRRNLMSPDSSRKSLPSSYQGTYWKNTADLSKKGDHGGVHTNNAVISHAAYLMWKGIDGSDSFEALTTEQLAKLFYATLYTLPEDCTFSQFRTLTQHTARTMNFTEKQLRCISNAFFQVGIPETELSVAKTISLDVLFVDGTPDHDYTVYVRGNGAEKTYTSATVEAEGLEFPDVGNFEITVIDNAHDYIQGSRLVRVTATGGVEKLTMTIADKVKEENPSIPTDAVEFNGHYYYLYDVDNTWENAQAYCEAVGGYLAAITSQEENEFLYNYMRQRGYDSAYFGLSNTQNGTWQWSSGEALSYINWHSGEPNNESNSEHYGMFYWKYTDGTWNDGDFGRKTSRGGTAFLCEWGDLPHIGQSRPETLKSGFHYEMKTEVIEFPLSDGTLYYSNTIKYPYFVGNSVIESTLNQRYADMIAYCKANDTDYDEQYQEWGDDEARLPYYDDTSSEVLYDGRGAISVKEIHVMWSGGMHPYHEVIGLNYDLATGKELTYHDILDGTDEQIDSVLRYYYEKGRGKATDFIVSTMKEYTAYALCEEGLCFFYNVGDAVERAEIIIPYTSDDTYVISLSDLLP